MNILNFQMNNLTLKFEIRVNIISGIKRLANFKHLRALHLEDLQGKCSMQIMGLWICHYVIENLMVGAIEPSSLFDFLPKLKFKVTWSDSFLKAFRIL